MQPLFDRQHVLQQFPDGREGDLRRPLGLEIRQLRRRVHRQEFAQRAKRCLSWLLAAAAVPTRTAQEDIPKGSAKAQRVVALNRSRPPAVRTRPVVGQVNLQLLPHERLLELPEYGLGVAEGKSNVLHPVTAAINGVNRHGERPRRDPLNMNLNGELHLNAFL